jgi:hypothetical protein
VGVSFQFVRENPVVIEICAIAQPQDLGHLSAVVVGSQYQPPGQTGADKFTSDSGAIVRVDKVFGDHSVPSPGAAYCRGI